MEIPSLGTFVIRKNIAGVLYSDYLKREVFGILKNTVV